MVDEDRPVTQVPVKDDESVLTHGLLRREVRQVLVQVETEAFGLADVHLRDRRTGEPREDVADPGLAGLIGPEPGGDAVAHDAAHPGDLGEHLTVHDVAGRGAHDREHLPGGDRPSRG